MSAIAAGQNLRLVGRMRGRPLRTSMRSVVWAWCFGAVFYAISTGAALTVFARSLGASTAAFGVLAAMPYLAMLIQLPASYCVESLQRRKPFFLVTTHAQRLLWVLVACVPWVCGWLGCGGQVAALLGLVTVACLLGACAAPAWWAWLSMIVPERVRGRYMARRATLGLLLSMPAALLVGLALDWASVHGTVAVLQACTLIFLVGAACGVMDIRVIDRRVDEPTRPVRPAGMSLRAIIAEPLANPGFRRYLAYIAVLNCSVGMLTGYLWLYVLEEAGAAKSVASLILLVCPSLGLLVATNAWGRLIDRYGCKATLLCASMLTVLLPAGWLTVGPNLLITGFLLTFLGGVGWAGVQTANTNIVLDYSGRSGSSTYSAIWSMTAAVGIAAGAGISLVLVLAFQHTGVVLAGVHLSFYQLQFIISTLVRIVAIAVLLPRIDDLQARPTAHNVRRLGSVWMSVRTLPVLSRRRLTARYRLPLHPAHR